MGKKQHQKDKLYLTNTEWRTEYGGYKGTQNAGEAAKFRRLPFSCCSLSLQPFEQPLCTDDGVIFDLMSIVPFLKKFGINPSTGEKISAKHLIKLNFHKNPKGSYHCPVTFKVFNENTHIVAIKPTGNVYAYESVERLNLKANYLKDLLTDEVFTKKDIITIQDPTNLSKFNLANFYHLKNKLKVDDDDVAARKSSKYHLKTINAETRDILDTLEKEYKASDILRNKGPGGKKADTLNAAHYSTGAVAASFTSTAMVPQTEHEAAVIDEDILRYARVKKKGYVRMLTNMGILNLELHCDMVPKTCENFIKHCVNGYYDNTKFHRSIRNFMIQGGDPEGTGEGGASIWGEPFKDEFKPNLTHGGRGILSMANSGPSTNKSQFFFTYRSCHHLDGKHAIFGRVVGGLDTLDKMERIETDKKDRPKEEVKIDQCVVFVDPYEEADEQLAEERVQEQAKLKAEQDEAKKQQKRKKDKDEPVVFKQGIGKYINPSTMKSSAEERASSSSTEPVKKKFKATYNFGNFSTW